MNIRPMLGHLMLSFLFLVIVPMTMVATLSGLTGQSAMAEEAPTVAPYGPVCGSDATCAESRYGVTADMPVCGSDGQCEAYFSEVPESTRDQLTAASHLNTVASVQTARVGFIVAENENRYGVTPDMVSLDGFDALSQAGFKGDPTDGREMIYVPAGTMIAFPGDVNGNAYIGVDVDGTVSECWDSASHKCTSADVLPSTVV